MTPLRFANPSLPVLPSKPEEFHLEPLTDPESPNESLASYTPDVAWPVSRAAMPFPEQSEGSGFDVIKAHSMLQPEVGRTHDISDRRTVEQLLGVDDYEHYNIRSIQASRPRSVSRNAAAG
jgi:hypothetical protein